MTSTATLGLLVATCQLALKLAIPLLAAALLAGVLLGLIQAATGVSDPSISQVPRWVAVVGALALCGTWMLVHLQSFFQQVLGDFLPYVH